MKKLLLSVAVLLAIAWASASWYVGRQTEPALQQFIDAANKQYESYGITQEIVSYKSGLFRSHAITKLTTSTAPLNEIIGDMQFANDITNGPVFFGGSSPVQFGISRITTRLDMDSLDEDKRQWLAEAFGGEQPCESHAIINFNGVVDYSVSLNPMKLDSDGTTFVIQGADLAGSADADMLGAFRMHTDNIEVRTVGSSFSVPSLESSGTITGIIAGQAIGSFNVSMPQVTIKSQDSAQAFIFDADVKTSSDVIDNAVEGTLSFTMDNIQGAWGVLNKLDYSAEFEGLNIAGLEAINQITKDMANLQNQMALDDEAMQTPEGQQKMQELLSGFPDRFITVIFSDLLQTGKSRMHHVLVAESPGGAGTADIDLTYIGEGTPSMTDLASYGPDDWAAMMKGTIMLNIDRSMLPGPFVMMLMPVIQQGIVVEEGSQLKATIELAGESVILNGTRMRFTDLLHMISPPTAENTAEENIDAAPDIPEDIMLKIQEEGLTPELMQLLEERDDVPAKTVEMFRQLHQLQQEMQAVNMPDQK